MKNVVELRNATKRFKDFSVENIDLEVKQGLITGDRKSVV